MKLIERLSQEHLNILNEDEKIYPFSIGDLKKSLSEKHSWMELTVREGQVLIVHLFGSSHISSYFDTLCNIFSNEKALEEAK